MSSRRLPLLTVLVVSQAAGVTLIAAIVLADGDGAPGGLHLLYGVLAGLAGTVGIAAFYRGLAVGAMSIVAPITATGTVVPVLVGVAQGERPSSLQGAGIALALLGVILASREVAVEGERARLAAGFGWAVVGAITLGLVLVALDASSEGDPLWGTLAFRATSFGLFVGAALVLRPSLSLRRPHLLTLLLVGVLDIGGVTLFSLASTRGLLSIVSVLSALFPVVTVLLARIFLHERIARSQAVGVGAALGGVALITAGYQ